MNGLAINKFIMATDVFAFVINSDHLDIILCFHALTSPSSSVTSITTACLCKYQQWKRQVKIVQLKEDGNFKGSNTTTRRPWNVRGSIFFFPISRSKLLVRQRSVCLVQFILLDAFVIATVFISYHECLDYPLPKIGLFFPVFILLLFCQSFSAKTKCKCEFPDYSSCGLIMSKLNQSVHAFLIHTVKVMYGLSWNAGQGKP